MSANMQTSSPNSSRIFTIVMICRPQFTKSSSHAHVTAQKAPNKIHQKDLVYCCRAISVPS